MSEIPAVVENPALIRLCEAHQAFEQHTLARAAHSDNQVGATREEQSVYSMQNGCAFESLPYVRKFDHALGLKE